MASDETGDGVSTRRDYVKYGGALIGGGLFAGCTGSGGSGSNGSGGANGSSGSTGTQADTASDASGDSTETGGGTNETDGTTSGAANAYSVTMAPMGEVTFEAVPKTIFTRLTHLAGMAFALGRGNDVNAMHAPDYYDALWNQFTPRLPGVSLDWSGLYSSWEPSKEKLYELDSDVHLADPASVFAVEGWNESDLAEIEENVAPWFGNQYSDTHATPPKAYQDQYRYYSLWDMFEKVAAVFQEQERYRALSSIHSDLRDTIESELPAKGERPTVALLGLSDLESIYAYKVSVPGFLVAHIRPLKPAETFGDDVSSGDTVDTETLLAADPEVILALGGMHPDTDMPGIRSGLADDPVAADVTAVKNDRVYAQGARYQGPILNLFQLEMSAKQLYPERFGEWPTYEKGPYPEIPANEQLFDRERVARIITGEGTT